ncbi:MAG: S28 family serine protease [Bacteroidota bacterium]
MKKNLLLLSCICTTSLMLSAQSIVQRLFELPDVIFDEIESADGFQQTFELRIKQPLDHQNPNKGHFYQKVFLSHRDFAAPMVMVTEGYNRNRNRIYELTELLEANQLDIEHRYFGKSIPDSLDYTYLNLEQATADYHRINQLFKQIYQTSWLSTGISKGGATTIFYKYFFPDDVVASVPYVAPINRSFEDPRIYEFLRTIGEEACREDILDFQKTVLRKRTELLPLLRWYNKGARYQFEYFSEEAAFELAVLEYPFSFWQYGHDCTLIPSTDASVETLLEHLLLISGTGFFSDDQVAYYGSHYYQSAEEMGYYGYETKDFAGLLQALPMSPNPHAAFVPGKEQPVFDGQLLQKVNAWLEQGVDRMIYINGAIDTWSATAVPAYNNADALWFFMEGKHHGNARIRNMSEAEKAQLMATLHRWLSEK